MNKKVMLVCVNRDLKGLCREVKKFKFLAGLALACAVISEFKRGKLEEELYRLNVRLKKLERSEEE